MLLTELLMSVTEPLMSMVKDNQQANHCSVRHRLEFYIAKCREWRERKMKCVNCGTEVNTTHKFCRQCGMPVPENEQSFLRSEVVGTEVINSPESHQLSAETAHL